MHCRAAIAMSKAEYESRSSGTPHPKNHSSKYGSSPRSMSPDLARTDKNHKSSSASKSGFDTSAYSFGDEDDDLRRAIALSEV
jgi:hypothetical protein